MSAANKCDLCGGLYEDSSFGAVGIDTIYVNVGDKDGTCENWSDVDLCATCARPLLKLLQPALEGLEDKYTEGG